MCNINLIIKKDGIPSKKVVDLMNVMTYSSYLKNKDGDGFYTLKNNRTLKHIEKSTNKIKIKSPKEWFICSHQRYTTSGHDEKYTHPFETEDFVLVHNGVFYNLGSNGASDTSEFVEKLQENYSKKKGMVEAIKKTVSKVQGYFSVVVYDKNDKQVYYFKDEGASISLIENKDYFILSTSDSNLDYVNYEMEWDEQQYTLKNNKIYTLLDGLKIVGEFKKQEYHFKRKKSFYSSYSNKSLNISDKLEEELEEPTVFVNKKSDHFDYDDYYDTWDDYEDELSNIEEEEDDWLLTGYKSKEDFAEEERELMELSWGEEYRR